MIRSLRGLRGFYGSTAPKMPFGLNAPINGSFASGAKPTFPFGLNISTSAEFPLPGKSTFPKIGPGGPSLGCGSCSGKRLGGLRRRLGQIYDPVTGDYTSSLPAQDNPTSLPLAPTQAAFNANPYAYSGIAAGGEAGASIANFTAATGYSPIASPSGGSLPSSAALFSLPSVTTPTASVGAASTSSSYLPWLVLGFGGLVFVMALKRR